MVLRKIAEYFAGDSDRKALKAAEKQVPLINEFFDKFTQDLKTEDDYKSHMDQLKKRVQEDRESLDDLLPEVFGLVKAACKFMIGRKLEVRDEELEWNMVPYDVQLIGGIILHNGSIAEMKTGEGKTLVCTMPIVLNALSGKSVFVITVNDYLARRDSEWMGYLFEFLGLSTGLVIPGADHKLKKEMYSRDVVYGTNNEFGFDYLRDNMATKAEKVVQPDLSYVIIDEVDSILIDEARTPLIISAPAEESTKKYFQYSQLVTSLIENEDYNIDEKQKVASLSEEGIEKIERMLGIDNIYAEGGFREIHHIENALKAKAIFKRDVDYVIKDGEVLIVDEFTGRLMAGRRYSDGLHQAIEAKEGVEVKRESRTLATITFQNYFRLFDKLSGMTGTAKTEEEEFYKIYGLPTVVIPTNKPIARDDRQDLIFKSVKGKFMAIAQDVKKLTADGQPVLVGTVSVEKSEALSQILKMQGVKHEVLNAKQHAKEAEIVRAAGQQGSVTIATNMAGRGTDIKLSKEALEAGGLFVIGSERHESRRIDNQLRGRSGRQGDLGVSQFYVSVEDDLMRIFGGDRVKSAMEAMKMPEDMPISNRFISRSIEGAQTRVEGRNFDIRKHVVEYDDVMNYHREIVYKKRKAILFGEDLHNDILLLMEKESEGIVLNHRNLEGGYNYQEIFETVMAIHRDPSEPLALETISQVSDQEILIDLIKDYFWKEYQEVEAKLPDPEILRQVEREVYLSTIDGLWMEHIDEMHYLRQNVALQAYGQRDPLLEYKDRSYIMIQNLLGKIGTGVVNTLFKIEIKPIQKAPVIAQSNDQATSTTMTTNSDEINSNLRGDDKITKSTQQYAGPKVGRNDPCPCGSGKKFKKCCGR